MMEPMGSPVTATGYGPGGMGPGGGAPPGGGYGPPPGGGGYGGPPGGPPPGGPPGGAWGGGGYGGPPPGGGYGPPPGGFGGPGPMPPSPPKKSGPNVGLIVGLGCGGLFVLGGIAALVLVLVGRKSPSSSVTISAPTSTAPEIATAGGSTPLGGADDEGSYKAELRNLRDFKDRYGKTRHFVGEIHNTGTKSIGFPSAKVTLYDATNTAVDSGTCAGIVRVLPPGEKVPCTFSVFKGASYTTFKTEIKPTRSYFKGDLAKLKISDIKFTPAKGYKPNQLDGKLTNESSFKAKNVMAMVSFYGSDGKIVGATHVPVAGNDLDPGTGGMFSAKVYNIAAKVDKYEVVAVGYSE